MAGQSKIKDQRGIQGYQGLPVCGSTINIISYCQRHVLPYPTINMTELCLSCLLILPQMFMRHGWALTKALFFCSAICIAKAKVYTDPNDLPQSTYDFVIVGGESCYFRTDIFLVLTKQMFHRRDSRECHCCKAKREP